MATHLPARLRTTDVQRFALRASQLETAKPAIAYWCEYWIVNQLLTKGLHNADTECLQYTTNLMDKLEQTKAEYASDDAIVDDTAGSAYVEQFGLETFERADRAVRANKVTRQTADTFLAASTFLELLNIWGAPDDEISAKVRYAKWNALRITKAIKEGKDPNETNPRQEAAPQEDLQALDPNDPEVQNLIIQPSKLRQTSVEDVPDEQDQIESRLAAHSITDQSLYPSREHSARTSPVPIEKFDPYPRTGFPYNVARDDVSPLESADTLPNSNDRVGSVGGGYFPEVSTLASGIQPPPIPTAPPAMISETKPDHHPPSMSSSRGYSTARQLESETKPTAHPQDFYRPVMPSQQPLPQHRLAPALVTDGTSTLAQSSKQGLYNTDDVAITKAQKHARFAISALNFDDAATAVKELRAALQTLGAQ